MPLEQAGAGEVHEHVCTQRQQRQIMHLAAAARTLCDSEALDAARLQQLVQRVLAESHTDLADENTSTHHTTAVTD